MTPVGVVLMKSAPVVMMRIVGSNALPIVRASVSTILYEVHNTLTGALTDSGSLDKTAIIYDTLQLDTLWDDFDSTGYNFKHSFTDGSLVFDSATVFQIDYKITMASGQVYRANAIVRATKIYMSV